jgi:hypothetical protein
VRDPENVGAASEDFLGCMAFKKRKAVETSSTAFFWKQKRPWAGNAHGLEESTHQSGIAGDSPEKGTPAPPASRFSGYRLKKECCHNLMVPEKVNVMLMVKRDSDG